MIRVQPDLEAPLPTGFLLLSMPFSMLVEVAISW
jgi:hypothetical protein